MSFAGLTRYYRFIKCNETFKCTLISPANVLIKSVPRLRKRKMFSTMTSHRRINQEKCRKTIRLRLVCSALLTTNNIHPALHKLFINFFNRHKTLSCGKTLQWKPNQAVLGKNITIYGTLYKRVKVLPNNSQAIAENSLYIIK